MLKLNDPENTNAKSRKPAIMLGALALMLCVFGFLVLDRIDFNEFFGSAPALPAPAPTAAQKSGPASAPASTPVSTPASTSARASAPVPHPLAVVSAATTARLTQLQGDLEVKKLELALFDIEQKMAPAVPIAVLPPVNAAAAPVRESKSRVLAVEGLGHDLYAVILTTNGSKTVRAGDKLEGGRIASITAREVVWRNDAGLATSLPFEE